MVTTGEFKIELYPITGLTNTLNAHALATREQTLSEYLFKSAVDRLQSMLEAAGDPYRPKTWFTFHGEFYFINYPLLAGVLSEYLQAQEIKSAGRLSRSYGASSSGDCLLMRSLPLAGFYPQREFNAEWVLSARVGDILHEAAQTLMKEIPGLLVDQEVWGHKDHIGNFGKLLREPATEVALHLTQMDPGLREIFESHLLSCRVDFISQRTKKRSGVIIGDIKTSADAKYWQDRSNWRGWYEDKLQHWARQIITGIYFYRDATGQQANSGRIFEIGRDSFQFREYVVSYDQYCEDWIKEQLVGIKRAKGLVDAFNSNYPTNSGSIGTGTGTKRESHIKDELPAPEPGSNCKFCGYQKTVCPNPGK